MTGGRRGKLFFCNEINPSPPSPPPQAASGYSVMQGLNKLNTYLIMITKKGISNQSFYHKKSFNEKRKSKEKHDPTS